MFYKRPGEKIYIKKRNALKTKPMNLQEHLDSRIPRILESYGKECFNFSNKNNDGAYCVKALTLPQSVSNWWHQSVSKSLHTLNYRSILLLSKWGRGEAGYAINFSSTSSGRMEDVVLRLLKKHFYSLHNKTLHNE